MAGNHKVEIIVGVKDLASASLQNIAKAASSMRNSLGNGSFMGAFTSNIDNAIKSLDKMANSMYKFNMYTADIRRNLTNLGAIGLGATAAVGMQGMNNALEFDYNTRVMQSRMGVSDKVRSDINDYILDDLNLKVSYGPNELAKMGIILGQGGVNNTKDMKSMLKTTSYFAEAVDGDAETAAQMIIAASKGFGINMEKSSQISDKLTVALNQSLLGVNEMPHAIGELAGRAKMYGQSFDSSLVALMTGRDQGMSAAQMSQDFLHGLRSLSKIGREELLPDKTRKWYSELGVDTSFFDMEKKQLKEYPEIIESLEKTMMNKGLMKNKDDLAGILKDNGGVLPDDFLNKMESLPLISKVFGAAGMAPIAMGLQSTFEETDPETGEKTGKIYYGSEALKKRRELVQNSEGETDKTHEIIAKSGKFNVEVLRGAWEATQSKFLDSMVPAIKTTSEVLTDFLSNKKVPEEGKGSLFDRFRGGIKESADLFRKDGNHGTANFVEDVGNGMVNAAQVSTTFPAIGKKIGGAFMDNFVKADWGDSLITFPWHLIKNSFGFIKDIASANKEFNRLVEELPQNLQDPAKLVNALATGGIALIVGGAIVKTLELSFRAASAALKTGKGLLNAGELIKDIFTGGLKDKGAGGIMDKLLGNDKVIKANIVNVSGQVVNVNDGPDGPDGKGKKNNGGSGGAGAAGGSGSANNRTGGGAAAAGGAGPNRNANTRAERYAPPTTRAERYAPATTTAGKIAETGSAFANTAKSMIPRAGGLVAGLSLVDIISGALGGPSFIKSTLQGQAKNKQAETNKYYDTVVKKKNLDNIPKQTEIKAGHGASTKTFERFGPEMSKAAATISLASTRSSNSVSKSASTVEKSSTSTNKAATNALNANKGVNDSVKKSSDTVAKSSIATQGAILGQSKIIGAMPVVIGSSLQTGFIPLGAGIIQGQMAAGQAIQGGIESFGTGVVGGVNNVASAVGNIKVTNVNNNTVNVPAPVVNVSVAQAATAVASSFIPGGGIINRAAQAAMRLGMGG